MQIKGENHAIIAVEIQYEGISELCKSSVDNINSEKLALPDGIAVNSYAYRLGKISTKV